MMVPRLGMNWVTRNATSQLKVVHREEETAWTTQCEEDERCPGGTSYLSFWWYQLNIEDPWYGAQSEGEHGNESYQTDQR